MVESKGWNWKIVKDSDDCVWKNPSVESYYLLNRWKSQGKNLFLDLGCGLGRHSILFGQNGFKVSCFDISEESIDRTEKWATSLNLVFDYKVGDMLELPYEDSSMDCILCKNVISHTDTIGMKMILKKLYDVLKDNGECYITLGSKKTWGFNQENWPLIDQNTRMRMQEGPEYKTPHFYADYNLIMELFSDFEIVFVNHIEDFYESKGQTFSSWHYHILVKKVLKNNFSKE